MADDIDVNEAVSLVDQGALLLDVREIGEWDAGHAPAAQHIPLSVLMTSFDSLPNDRQIVVVCKVGGRSSQAAAWLEQQGLNALNLDGGMLAWAASGLPVTDNDGADGVIV